MSLDSNRGGFSLVELIMAVGIAAVAVIGVVGLYRPVVRTVSGLDEETRVQRILERVESVWRERGLAEVLTATSASDPFFADRDGSRLGSDGDAVWLDAGATEVERDIAKVFEFTLHRHPELSPVTEVSPGSVVIVVQLRWPAHRLDGTRVTDPSLQEIRWAVFAVGRP